MKNEMFLRNEMTFYESIPNDYCSRYMYVKAFNKLN